MGFSENKGNFCEQYRTIASTLEYFMIYAFQHVLCLFLNTQILGFSRSIFCLQAVFLFTTKLPVFRHCINSISYSTRESMGEGLLWGVGREYYVTAVLCG